MSEAANHPPGSESAPRYIRWDDDEWEAIERASELLGKQVHATIKPTEFVRGAAKKRAEEILSADPAAVAGA